MTKHGQDPRIKSIADNIKKRQAEEALGPKYWCSPYDAYSGMWHPEAPTGPFGWSPTELSYVNDYLPFLELESEYKEWDIKRKIKDEVAFAGGIVLCGETCDWYDYST
jgi:hypothetical protein